MEEWIYDFTTYTYMILLDGKIYTPGTEISEEGWHTLELQVRDAAGNASVARAVFKVDHTAPSISIDGVEENGIYEEAAAFQISIGNEEDHVDYIEINGEKQPLNYLEQQYKYAVQEPKYYEIEVCASDKAGNRTVQRVGFEVQEKRTIVERMMSPLKKNVSEKLLLPVKKVWNKILKKNEKSGITNEIEGGEKVFAGKSILSEHVMVFGVIMVIVLLGCVGGILWKKKKN